MTLNVFGKACVFCGMWYEDVDITVCIKCKEYKGMVEITEDQWNSEEFIL